MKLLVQFWFCFFITSFAVAQGPCNNAASVTYQGYQYDLVEIGDQCWFAENLRASFYSNGDVISSGLTDSEWANDVNGAATPSSETMGWLYNFYAVTNGSGLCPNYWTVPAMYDWMVLLNHLGGLENANEALKDEIEWNGSNSSGFSALPAGIRFSDASYDGYGERTQFWSSSAFDNWGGEGIEILTDNSLSVGTTANDANYGFSVRCLASAPLLLGCTDSQASNYDPTATADDGSCTYPPGPCNNATSITYQGYEYEIVEIGDQCWFAENLRCTHYLNGDSIPGDLDDSQWQQTTSGAQAIFDDLAGNLDAWGRLYNWYAVEDDRGLCPNGWYVPSDNDCFELEFFIGMNASDVYTMSNWRGEEAHKLKSSTLWNGTNTTGFSGVASGNRYDNGVFSNETTHGYFWTSSTTGNEAIYRGLNTSNPGVGRYPFDKGTGYSVRCLKDTTIIQGCTIEQGCNYNPEAMEDDGSCLFIGESCDDGDDTTTNDIVNENCTCEGEVISGCTYAVACNYDPLATVFDGSCLFPGDSCDDGDPETINDSLNDDCECAGEPGISGCLDEEACNFNAEANADDGSCAYAGDSCDDGNEFTENDVYSDNCECSGTEVEIVPGCVYESACNFNPEANQDDMSCLFPGDSCDDEDVTTGDDTYTEDCECVGEPLIGGCTYESACNFNPDAQFDDSSCIFIGDSCDDGDSETENDVINMDCDCVGTPITSVGEVGLVSMTVYPNPVSDQLTIELGTLQGTLVRVQIFDAQGKLVFDESRVDRILLDVSAYTPGPYTIQAGQGADRKQVQFIIE